MRVIVAYDITEPRRIKQVADIILDYGERVLKSVYEVHVSKAKLAELQRRVKQQIDPNTDAVKFYLLCGRCCDNIEMFGLGKKLVIEERLLII